MRANSAGVELIKRHEGLRLRAYRCPAGKWTVGWGHTGSDLNERVRITEHQAEAILDVDLDTFERGVAEVVTVDCTSNEFSALVCLAFNIGMDAFAKSRLLKKLNAGDKQGAAAEFAKWIHAGGQVLPGLVARRKDEAELFLLPDATNNVGHEEAA